MKLKLSILLLIAIGTTTLKAQDTASAIIQNALVRAKAENKNVFVKYSASWCGWCKKMDKQIKSDSCKPLFDANYVFVDLVVQESKENKHLETPGALDLLQKYKGEKAGLPFWVVLDNEGNLIEDSFNAQGQNLGCTATKEEIATFIAILKKTSNLTDEALGIIAGVFRSK